MVHLGAAVALPTELTGFFQLAAAGAIITAAFQFYRDRLARRDSARDAILGVIGRIDEAYRTSKQIKRQLRARNLLVHPPPGMPAIQDSLPPDDPGSEKPKTRYLVPAPFFEERMDELSRVQLTLEEIRQIIRVRRDLLPEKRITRLLELTSYSDDYIHDVVEDFEARRMHQTSYGCLVTGECGHLQDFLDKRWRETAVDGLFKELDENARSEARYDVVMRIVQAADKAFADAKEHERRRTKRVSDLCLRSALAEMREAVAAISTRWW